MAKKNTKAKKKNEMIRSDLEYYSSSIALEDIEDIDVSEIEIPKDMFDDSKDVLESDGEEDNFFDYDVFEDAPDDVDMSQFEGKTEDEIQAMLMQNIQNMAGESNQQTEEVENIITEDKTDIPEEAKIDLSASLDENQGIPDIPIASMFQMTEEEVEAELQNVQNAIESTVEENGAIEITIPEEKIEEEEIEAVEIPKEPEKKEDSKKENNKQEDSKKEDVFDKYANDNSDKKKYVFAVNQKYAERIDSMSQNERDKFISHAIDLKLEADHIKEKKENTISFFVRVFIIVFTIIIGTPLMFKMVNWSMDSTSASYEYCQKSFEKLFKQSFAYRNKN